MYYELKQSLTLIKFTLIALFVGVLSDSTAVEFHSRVLTDSKAIEFHLNKHSGATDIQFSRTLYDWEMLPLSDFEQSTSVDKLIFDVPLNEPLMFYRFIYLDDPFKHLKEQIQKILNGERKALNVLRIGDSLTARCESHFSYKYLRALLPNQSGVEVADAPPSSFFGRIGGIVAAQNGVKHSKVDYNLSPTGSYYEISPEKPWTIIAANTVHKIVADRVLIPYIISPEGGRFEVFLTDQNSGIQDYEDKSWYTPDERTIVSDHALNYGRLVVNCNGDDSLGVLEIEFENSVSLGLKIEYVDGSECQLIPPMFERRLVEGINKYHIGEGSNNFSNVTALGMERLFKLIEVYKPDLITFHSDDNANAYGTLMPLFHQQMQQLEYSPSILFFGEGPKRTYTATIAASNTYQSDFTRLHGYAFVNAFDVIDTYEELEDRGLQGDGVHLSPSFYEMVADLAGELYLSN